MRVLTPIVLLALGCLACSTPPEPAPATPAEAPTPADEPPAAAAEETATLAASAAPVEAGAEVATDPAAADIARLETAAADAAVEVCRDYFKALASCLAKAPRDVHAEMLNGIEMMIAKSKAGVSAEDTKYAEGRCKVSLTIGIPNNPHCK
jgi:hypothetical protein